MAPAATCWAGIGGIREGGRGADRDAAIARSRPAGLLRDEIALLRVTQAEEQLESLIDGRELGGRYLAKHPANAPFVD